MFKLVAVLTTLAALAVVSTAEAQIEPVDHQRGASWGCREGYVCVFECRGDQGYYDGERRGGGGDVPGAGCQVLFIDGGFRGWHNFNRDWKNAIEAMINTRGRIALFAGNVNGFGRRYCAEPNSSDRNFGNNHIGNDNAESFKLYHQDGRCARFGY